MIESEIMFLIVMAWLSLLRLPSLSAVMSQVAECIAKLDC